MKKLITSLIAVLLLISTLSSCGTPKAETDASHTPNQTGAPQQTETSQQTGASNQSGVPAGTILTVAEKNFHMDSQDVYLCFVRYAGGSGEAVETRAAVDHLSEDSYVLYGSDNGLIINEVVYEVSNSGIVKYFKSRDSMDSFAMETEASHAELVSEVNTWVETMSYFMFFNTEREGVQLRKTDTPVSCPVGEVYTYELIEDGTVTGLVSIHQETGLLVDMKDAEGNTVLTVTELRTSDLGIPNYK